MQNELTFPYRRFSSDMYASSLIELLDAHAIPFEIVSEPEGIGSVFLGEAGIPGVIVMVNPTDAKKVLALEKGQAQPEEFKATAEEAVPVPEEKPDSLHPMLIFGGYVFAFLAAPISIIFGWHILSARRRQSDLSYVFAYPEDVRRDGKRICAIGLVMLVIGFARMLSAGGRGNILDSLSFVLSFFTY